MLWYGTFKMNGALRSYFELYSKPILSKFKSNISKKTMIHRLYSTFWRTTRTKLNPAVHFKSTHDRSFFSNLFSTASENRLLENIERTITRNELNVKNLPLPSKIKEFEVQLDGSRVFLTKGVYPEGTISVRFNVNHSVIEERFRDDSSQIVSKPNFKIDLTRGNTTLRFECEFFTDENTWNFCTDDEDEEVKLVEESFCLSKNEDAYGYYIRKVALHEGKINKNNYHYPIFPPESYRLVEELMRFLKDEGITNSFLREVVEFSTAYEKKRKLDCLENLKKFTLNCKEYLDIGENELMKRSEGKITKKQDNIKMKPVPFKINDFEINLEGPQVLFAKSIGSEETIRARFNTYHSAVEQYLNYPGGGHPPVPLMFKPNFHVDVTRGDTTLRFSCVFFTDNNVWNHDFELAKTCYNFSKLAPQYIFYIREFALYKGKKNENDCSYPIFPPQNKNDQDFYFKLMEFLNEEGISTAFLRKVIQFCEDHGDKCRRNFLVGLKKFGFAHKE